MLLNTDYTMFSISSPETSKIKHKKHNPLYIHHHQFQLKAPLGKKQQAIIKCSVARKSKMAEPGA